MRSKEILQGLRSEMRDMLARQLATQSELDAKAADSIKFNTLVFGIVVSSLSLASRELPLGGSLNGWIAASFIGGLGLLGGSIFVGMMAYRTTRLGVGLQAESIQDKLHGGLSEKAILKGMIRTYTDLLEENRDKIDATANRVDISMGLLVSGLSLLGMAMAALMYLAI